MPLLHARMASEMIEKQADLIGLTLGLAGTGQGIIWWVLHGEKFHNPAHSDLLPARKSIPMHPEGHPNKRGLLI
jgi:hypothetical protein